MVNLYRVGGLLSHKCKKGWISKWDAIKVGIVFIPITILSTGRRYPLPLQLLFIGPVPAEMNVFIEVLVGGGFC